MFLFGNTGASVELKRPSRSTYICRCLTITIDHFWSTSTTLPLWTDCQFMTQGLEFEIFGDAASTIRSEPSSLTPENGKDWMTSKFARSQEACFFFGPVWICCKTLSYFFIICGVFCFPQGKKWELALPCVMFLMPLIGVSLGHWDIDADTIFGSRVRGPSNVSFGCRSMMREFCGCYAGHCKLMTQM